MSLNADSAAFQKRSGAAETQVTSEGSPKLRMPDGPVDSTTALTCESPYCCSRSAMRWSVLFPATSKVARGTSSVWFPATSCSELASNRPRISMVPLSCQCSEVKHSMGSEEISGGGKPKTTEVTRAENDCRYYLNPGNPLAEIRATTLSLHAPAEHCLRLLTKLITAVFSSSVEIDVIESFRVVRSGYLLEFLFHLPCAAKILKCRNQPPF